MSAIARLRALTRLAFIALVFTAAAACDATRPTAQELPGEITPEIENRSDQFDVPFVPTEMVVVETMLSYAKPTPQDYVIDLGSGDGRIVLTAVKKYGASGHGVDLNEGLVKVANARAAREGVAERASFHVRDLFKEDLSKATVVTMYLLPEVVLQLRESLFNLKPGTRIVSHDYHLGDWRFDAAEVVTDATGGNEDIVYYWVVPAKVAGQWEWTVNYPSAFAGQRSFNGFISQHYQDISGRVVQDLQQMRIHDASLQGDRVAFSVSGEIGDAIVRHDFEGRVNGDRIEGTVRLSGGIRPATLPWSAYRLSAEN